MRESVHAATIHRADSGRYATGKIVPVADVFKKRDDLAQKHRKML